MSLIIVLLLLLLSSHLFHNSYNIYNLLVCDEIKLHYLVLVL